MLFRCRSYQQADTFLIALVAFDHVSVPCQLHEWLWSRYYTNFLLFKVNDFHVSVCPCFVFLHVLLGIGNFKFSCSFDVWIASYELVHGLPEALIVLLHVFRFTVFILVFAITLYNLILRFLSNFRPLWAAWRSWRFFVKSWSYELCIYRPHISVFKLYNVSRNSTQ